ncbi:NAD(P)/FAD-dependent oxidoreductase [Actinomarinicola tropica]|uniref:NAD(P)/FAD-dependent oxidoreductase n=1 Tax=Actinomarinicola tropica TaxID=2789776 RepID=A0A5Q2RKS0_9ACTN|nr:FAD-dependent oxidoreductase [Actinomarinicola tropica]QGG96084.1 hypothetical protein GH723_13800 [Actinomarinicola tropica]
MDSITVVGASLAGMRAAQTLRREGFDGRIVVVGEEPDEPYDRPPLSKAYLTGEDPTDAVRPAVRDVDQLDLTWRRGRRAVALDVADRAVELDDGERIVADGVVLACGAAARRLPGIDGIEGVHVLRTLADARALRADLDAAPRRVLVVGAGFIGAEVAASCRERGLAVTIVEALPMPLSRVLPPPLAAWCAELHRTHDVDMRLSTGVEGVEREARGRVAGVRLADGVVVEADVVVVGIGVAPNTAWLEGSGLTLDDGVVCDATTLAAPGVVAAGDVARWDHPRYGLVRVEHWDNAVEMGAHAARRLLAGDDGSAFAPVPWFWSDQYDRKIQLAGRCRPDDDVHVVEGSLEEGRVVALIGRDGELRGVFGVNRPAPLNRWRLRLADGIGWDEAIALDG